VRRPNGALEATVYEQIMDVQKIALAIVLPVLMVCVSAFLSVAVWSQARRKEREALYRSETLKRVADASGPGSTTALEMMREHDRATARKRREELRLAGIVATAAGAGLMIFLRAIERREPMYLVGVIPVLVGLSLLVYGSMSAGRE
jgi:hypothetical protein